MPSSLASPQSGPGIVVVVTHWDESAGHDDVVPLQTSWLSHWSAAGRHTLPVPAKEFPGQAAPVPGQISATSQIPADERHAIPLANTLPGQNGLAPVHDSATSQTPADGLQTTPEFANGKAQKPSEQRSRVQGFPSLQTTGVWTHPLAGLQESTVHGSGSPHWMGMWRQIAVS
jgi:hypothetical protein